MSRRVYGATAALPRGSADGDPRRPPRVGRRRRRRARGVRERHGHPAMRGHGAPEGRCTQQNVGRADRRDPPRVIVRRLEGKKKKMYRRPQTTRFTTRSTRWMTTGGRVKQKTRYEYDGPRSRSNDENERRCTRRQKTGSEYKDDRDGNNEKYALFVNMTS